MRLLLVEDNKPLGELTTHALKTAGFAVDLVSDAEEADAAMSTAIL